MGSKNFQLGGGRWPFLPLKRGVKEDDDRTIKQDEPGGCALKRPTHQAKNHLMHTTSLLSGDEGYQKQDADECTKR